MTEIILIFIYMLASGIVSIETISRWKEIDYITSVTPFGDMDVYEFNSGYSILNYLFLPSILCIKIYSKISETVE